MPTLTFHRAANGKLAPCRATVRRCPKGEHITLDEQQQAFLKETFGIVDMPVPSSKPPAQPMSLADFKGQANSNADSRPLIEGRTYAPVLVTPSKLHEPDIANANFRNAHNYAGADYAFETADTYYDEVQIEQVNLRPLLADIFRTKEQHISNELLTFVAAKELNLDSTNQWTVTRGGYYDDDFTFTPYDMEALQRTLNEWYFAQSNATDRNGVLAYCRAKGLETAGLTPIEALRKQLAAENPGRTNLQVKAATGVEQRSLRFSQLEITPERLTAVEARPTAKPAAVTEYLDPIVGVVYPVQQLGGQGPKYVLVDGYHRLKGRLDAKKRVGEFLVLTRQP